jgi:molybdenum cofactor guanylyltransferase
MMDRWTGVILAGGSSTRMGRDKALIEIGGRTLLDIALDRMEPHVDGLMVIGDPDKYGHVGPFVFADETPGLGPLGGLITAMRYSSTDKLLVLACDMPGVESRLLDRLKMDLGNFTDAVVPMNAGRPEPLCAAYHRRCETTFRAAVERGELKMGQALEHLRVTRLEITPGSDGWPADLFRNLNSVGDL